MILTRSRIRSGLELGDYWCTDVFIYIYTSYDIILCTSYIQLLYIYVAVHLYLMRISNIWW